MNPQQHGRQRPAITWLVSGVRFISMVYLQALLWLAVWVLLPTLLLGYQAVAVDSGSMGPAVRMGDVVLAEPARGQLIDVGRIVTFRDTARDGKLVTHRVVGHNEDGTYQTKGDANRTVDSSPVDPSQITGVGKLVVPFVGRPIVWASIGQWAPLGLWVTLSLCALLFAFPGKPRQRRRIRPAPAPAAPALAAPAPTSTSPRRVLRAVAGRAPTARGPLVPAAPPPLSLPDPPQRLRLPAPPVPAVLVPPPPFLLRPARLPAPPHQAHATVPIPPLPAPRRPGASRARGPRSWAAPLHSILLVLAVTAGLLSVPLGEPALAAVFGSVVGNSSNAVSAATVGSPSNLQYDIGGLTNCRVDLDWTATASTWADGYKVYRDTGSGFAEAQTVTPYTTTSWRDESIGLNDTHHYYVVAYKGSWLSGATNTVTVSTGSLSC